LYDLDDNGYIEKRELLDMLRASLLENCFFGLSEAQLKNIIDYTFEYVDANHDELISREEYKSLVMKYPSALEDFKLVFKKPVKTAKETDSTES